MHHSQRGSQTGVLHADFDAERHALRALQTQQATDQIADTESEEVMKHHHQHDKQTCGHKPLGVMRNDNADCKGNGEGRERRQVRRDALRNLGNKTLAQQSAYNRQNNDINDAE